MKKIILMAALAFLAVLNASAQTPGEETSVQRYMRVTKAVDDNPTDWKALLEAAHLFLDPKAGFYNQQRGLEYYKRINNILTSYNKEIPDSVISETVSIVMTLTMAEQGSEDEKIDKSLFYTDELKLFQKAGININNASLNCADIYGTMNSFAKEDNAKALSYMMELRERVSKDSLPGIEHTDVMTAMLFDNLMAQYKEMYGDKLVEIYYEGKKYIFISLGQWNIENPLMGWSEDTDDDDALMLVYGEDGIVYDHLDGDRKMEFSFFCNKEGIVSKEGTNVQLITVTPERRQQLVEAYRNYMKKAKKGKKK